MPILQNCLLISKVKQWQKKRFGTFITSKMIRTRWKSQLLIQVQYMAPLTGNLSGASMDMIKKIITGQMPQVPNCTYVMSDVRDCSHSCRSA